jgi:hypothetical protein
MLPGSGVELVVRDRAGEGDRDLRLFVADESLEPLTVGVVRRAHLRLNILGNRGRSISLAHG